MHSQIVYVCPACYYNLEELHRVYRKLTRDVSMLVANAVVSTRLDYCSSLFYQITYANINRNKGIRNAICRTWCTLNTFSHVTVFLNKQQWLPSEYLTLFLKCNLVTYKTINRKQPPYPLSLYLTYCGLTWSISFSVLRPHPDPISLQFFSSKPV